MTNEERQYYDSTALATYTGRRVDPITMSGKEVDVRDIAHGLAHLCRFNGQCRRFYSVAEHSVVVSRLAEARVSDASLAREAARCGLLHDAAEAYMGDVIRPIKRRPEWRVVREIQDRLQNTIYDHFGVVDLAVVHEIDKELVLSEGAYLFPGDVHASRFPPARLVVKLELWTPGEAEAAFLCRYAELWP